NPFFVQVVAQPGHQRRFAGSAGRDIADTDDRNIRRSGFQPVPVVQKVANTHPNAVQPARWPQQNPQNRRSETPIFPGNKSSIHILLQIAIPANITEASCFGAI
ncbi:MAG: hypothetical protein L0Y36_06695, partial [Planctomycetales bacterium]|nr:hypothetical protein [Planctomycetales bacterium]